jgi:hypothetical protein
VVDLYYDEIANPHEVSSTIIHTLGAISLDQEMAAPILEQSFSTKFEDILLKSSVVEAVNFTETLFPLDTFISQRWSTRQPNRNRRQVSSNERLHVSAGTTLACSIEA